LDITFSHNALAQRYLIAEQAELLKRIKYRMRVMRMCVQCQAHPIPDKTCEKCGANAGSVKLVTDADSIASSDRRD